MDDWVQMGVEMDSVGEGYLRKQTRALLLDLLQNPTVPENSRKTLTAMLTRSSD